MAALGSAVLGKSLGRSTTEKSFRDFWTRVEVLASYSLLFISFIVIPDSENFWEPLECTYCSQDICGNFTNAVRPDPELNFLSMEKLCANYYYYYLYKKFLAGTYGFVFAAIILLTLGNIMGTDNAFDHLTMFASLLVKEKILKNTELHVTIIDDLEANEIKNKLRGRTLHTRYWKTAVRKVTFGLAVLAVATGIWMQDVDYAGRDFICQAHDRLYKCLGGPGLFFEGLVIAYFFLLLGVIICNMIKLTRLHPCFGRMNEVMRAYKKIGRTDIYDTNNDIRILINLLAENYGVAHAIAAIALFDEVIISLISKNNLKH